MVRYGYVKFCCWNILQNCICASLHAAAKFAKIGKRAPAKSAIFAIFAKVAKNWRNGKIC